MSRKMDMYLRRYFFYRRYGFEPARALIMAAPLWISVVLVPPVIMLMLLVLIRIV